CRHVEIDCPAQPCVEDLVCVPATGQCEGTPVDCGDGVCDPSAGGCVPCDFKLSYSSNHTRTDCPDSSDCLQCCFEGSSVIHPGFFDSCSNVVTIIDQFPAVCACLGCNCVGP